MSWTKQAAKTSEGTFIATPYEIIQVPAAKLDDDPRSVDQSLAVGSADAQTQLLKAGSADFKLSDMAEAIISD